MWSGDYYYVIGYSDKKNKVVTFRVDRIAATPKILDDDIVPQPNDFNLFSFTKEVFNMYDGQEVTVHLRCDNSLMKTMIDRFGEDVETLVYYNVPDVNSTPCSLYDILPTVMGAVCSERNFHTDGIDLFRENRKYIHGEYMDGYEKIWICILYVTEIIN